jgi:hypothetical protein
VKLEAKPAIQATLCLVLLVGLMVLLLILPDWVFVAVMLPLSLGFLWWLLYIAFRGFRLKKP